MTFYRSSADSRNAGTTYHLMPARVWDEARDAESYTPTGFEADGFIHCTDGLDEIVNVANRFYRNLPGEFVVIALDVAAVEADIRYDDPVELYPHIYGALNMNAVRRAFAVTRDDDGTFLNVEEA